MDLKQASQSRDYLSYVGTLGDRNIDLFNTALSLAAIHRPQKSIEPYQLHMRNLIQGLRKTFDDLCAKENGDSVHVQAKALATVMAMEYGYNGDSVDYDNLQNIDIMRVVDRRLGMPITLSVLAIAMCRAMGWHAEGLNFPGHFLMRLEKDGERLIYDSFQGGKILGAPELRSLLKANLGEDAELSNEYYEPCSNRDILLRLQNNIKYRLIDTEHYHEALEIVDLMTLIAPNDIRLKLDLAVLLARLERPKAAIDNLGVYIEGMPVGVERREAEIFMAELKAMLN